MAKNTQQILIDKGLIVAAASCSILKVRAALDFGANPNFQDPQQHGWAALHFCSYFSAEKAAERICKNLLGRGALPNVQAHDGTTPLMAAASVGSVDVVKMLLGGKADANLADRQGKTPLMGAADRGCVEIALVLLEGGADAGLTDLAGLGAIELARIRGHHECAAAIEASILKAEASPRSSKPRF